VRVATAIATVAATITTTATTIWRPAVATRREPNHRRIPSDSPWELCRCSSVVHQFTTRLPIAWFDLIWFLLPYESVIGSLFLILSLAFLSKFLDVFIYKYMVKFCHYNSMFLFKLTIPPLSDFRCISRNGQCMTERINRFL
jgi:hypothetical protein